MLKWFADRLAQTGREARKDERGFTLIELLVVVIIIGILAAIAIPTFLGQRENARDGAVQSDLRNAATAQESYFVSNDTYADGATGDDSLADEDFQTSSDVNLNVVSANGDGYCMGAYHTENSDSNDFWIDSDEGEVVDEQPDGCSGA